MPKHVSASSFVYSQVKELIIAGELPCGELTSEGALASLFGTSRTPVREAFLRLQTEGWMTLYPKRGAVVNPIAHGEDLHVAESRLLVETRCIRSFISNVHYREAAAAELRTSLTRQRALALEDGQESFSAEDAHFHAIFVTYGGNPLLSDFYAGLRDRQRRMSTSSVTRDPLPADRIIADHAELIDCLASGDAAQVCRLLEAHLQVVHFPRRNR